MTISPPLGMKKYEGKKRKKPQKSSGGSWQEEVRGVGSSTDLVRRRRPAGLNPREKQ